MAVLLCACSSRADRASRAAIAAEGYMQQGNLAAAERSAREATSLRDDISDYWLLLARIELTAGRAAGAYDAYQHVIELDRNNGEALNALVRLGISLGRAADVDRYADQILFADPSNRSARVMKAAAALQRGDKDVARQYIDAILTSNPQDIDGLVLKARLLASDNDAAGAARLIEGTLDAGAGAGDPAGRLAFLRTLYTGLGDRPNLLRTLQRLSATQNVAPDVQLAYAAMLYEEGRPGPAGETIIAVMRRVPDNVDVAADILEIWRDAGPGMPPAATLSAAGPSLSLEMKAAMAQRANDLGRPDIALAILGPAVATDSTSAANADARAAYAGALALRGDIVRARAMLDEILSRDPAQPRALLARARLAAARRDFTAAVADARRVVADDPRNVTARILLADYLRGGGEDDLALAQLREGARTVPESARMAGQLAEALIARGDKAGARTVLSDLLHAAPASARAAQLQVRLCSTMGDAGCVARVKQGAVSGVG